MVLEIQKYLDEEKFFERTTSQVFDEIGENEARWLDERINRPKHQWGLEEMYVAFARSIHGIPVYDYLKSRGRPMVEWVLEKILEYGIDGRARVLDVGCGTGLESGFIAGAVSQGSVFGLDTSRAMLDAASARKERRGLRNLYLVQGDRDTLPFQEGSFDRVVSINSLVEGRFYNFRDGALLLEYNLAHRFQEFRRVLREGGRLVLVEHFTVDDRYRQSYEMERMTGRLEQADFREISALNHHHVTGDDVELTHALFTGEK